jgi:hypothetical protein
VLCFTRSRKCIVDIYREWEELEPEHSEVSLHAVVIERFRFEQVFLARDAWKIQGEFRLPGKQLPGKYKENFDVSSEGPSSGVNSKM